MATTTTANSNCTTPTRRITWKDRDFQTAEATNEPFNEKDFLQYALSETTAHDLQPASPCPIRLPTRPRPSILHHDDDIEGQHDSGFPTRSSWRSKLKEYAMLFAIVVVWMLLIMGVLVLTDTLFPTALRSYHRFKEMGVELANTKFELEALKVQMLGVYRSVERVGAMTVQKLRR
ncbi:predicted protein [Plenodomus lingam JN3]|uniref:Predicted protein n=2 Tax=Leptosphaeria maculans TaxID=5022 RepID=E4ZK49_LEPMJ|nr:predicted protein [Plenodomus lingam JN3]CBX91644.1 predicted protein [Plenodomus lingam JN3]